MCKYFPINPFFIEDKLYNLNFNENLIVINHCANDDSMKKNGKELISSIHEVKLKLSSLCVIKKYVKSMCAHSSKFIYLKNLTFHLSDRIFKSSFTRF